jgi:hypothetical protein
MNVRLFVLLLAPIACGGGGTNTPDTGTGPVCPTHDNATFELGTGQLEFQEITDGQRLLVSPGSQGGCHFFLAVRTDGFAERRFNIQYEVFWAESSTTTGSRSSFRTRLRPNETMEGLCESLGITGYLIQAWKLIDKDLIIEVNVRDDEGRTAQQRKRIIGEWPPDLRYDACGPRT